MESFSLRIDDLGRSGSDLHRPELVLTTACGDLYVSDERGGVTRIAPDGRTTLYSGHHPDGWPLGANGFAMLDDGSFLIAPLVGGGVYRLYRDGRAEPWLVAVDGQPLSCPNFVLLDALDRIWICCLTQADRTTVSSYPRVTRDGFIVLVDRGEARIVAEGLGYPNEVRIDPTGRYLYTNETMAGRLLRFPISPQGELGPAETIIEYDESNVLDGFALDAAGGAWMTAIISNRLWYVSREGKARLLMEDGHAEQLERVAHLQRTTGMLKSVIYEEHGSRLRNISSVAFGGPDLRTVYLGCLMGDCVRSFRSPVAGMRPAHWDFGPFA